MDSFFREQESGTQEAPKSFLAGLKSLASLIKWLAGLMKLTEQEREEAGIYLGRPGPGGEEISISPADAIHKPHSGHY